MNPDRLKLPKSKPAPVAVSSHRAASVSKPTEKPFNSAVRGRKFSGLDPFTLSLIASTPIVTPVVRVARRVVVKANAAPVAVEPVAVAPVVVEPVVQVAAKPNRVVLALGAALAVGVAGLVGMQRHA